MNWEITSFVSNLCSVLFMSGVPTTSNVKHYYRDLGTRTVAGGTVRLIRVTAAKPGEAFTDEWSIKQGGSQSLIPHHVNKFS